MERRSDERHFRRLRVRFWLREESKERIGFTTNISRSGMFLGSNQVPSPGTRLRIEVLDPRHGFVVEGQVVRAIRVPPALRSVQTSGMGIRFVPIDELVSELFIKKAEPATQEMPAVERLSSPPAAASPAPSGSIPSTPALDPPPFDLSALDPSTLDPSALPPSPLDPPTLDPPPPGPATAPPPPAPDPVAPPSTAAPPSRSGSGGFTIRFQSIDEIRRLYERDLVHGGMFVSTLTPPEMGQMLAIELRLPGGDSVRFHARVVQRFEPRAADETNLLSGVGVELVDPERAQLAVRALLDGS